MKHGTLAAAALCVLMAIAHRGVQAQLRDPTPAEHAADLAAFQAVQRALADRLTDVQSVVVVLRGRVAYEFYRDGLPDKLRETQSVQKSALSVVTGVALGQGRLAGLDQPVLALMPQLTSLNRDPRAAAITVRHLLTMTAGFEVDDPAGIKGGGMDPRDAWARPMRSAPGEKFAYDNALIPMLAAVLEQAVGMPLADFGRQHLFGPLGMAEPSYQRGLQLRTIDMAKLGQLVLHDGLWEGKQILPADYVRSATEPQNTGGPPARLPYGYMWWVFPSQETRRTFMAIGYAGQLIWVSPALEMVVAATSTVSADSQRRGHAIELLRGGLISAAQQRLKDEPR